MKRGRLVGWVLGCAIVANGLPAFAQTHAPWPSDWNNWCDPNLWVTVGNPGNPGEWSGYSPVGCICGEVDYLYRISKYEVTAAQYTEFLNAVAKTDTYGLYSPWMWNGCKIERTGSPGSYAYTVTSAGANRPVNYVSWGDAARFCNWLANGQPIGDQCANTTEYGSYFLNGKTSNTDLMNITRRPGPRYVIPSEDEWYKAAYHKNDGVTGNYWTYPTGTDSNPSNILADPDPGNCANYFDTYGIGNRTYTIGVPYMRTIVGAFTNSASSYGTYDQGGNVQEWNEAKVTETCRGLRGGGYPYPLDFLCAYERQYNGAAFESGDIGFRIAEVPEPASAFLLSAAGLALLRRLARK